MMKYKRLLDGNHHTELQKRVNLVGMAGLMVLTVRYIISIILGQIVPASSVKTLMVSLMITLVTMVPPVVLCRRRYRLKNAPVSSKNKWVIVVTGAAGCMLLNFVINLLPWQKSGGKLFTDGNGLLLAIAAVGIVPAVCEELAFRGCAAGILEKYGKPEAIVVSAFMFGLFHSGWRGALLAFLSGLLLGWVKVRTGSILSSVIVHIVNNLAAIGVSAAGIFYSAEVQTTVFYAVGFTAAVLTAVCSVYWYGRYKHSGKKYSFRVNFRNLTEIAAGCPAIWVFTIVAVLTGVNG